MTTYIFDIDGTIRSNERFQPGDLLPGRATKIAQLVAEGARIGFASNQGGVAFGYTTEDAVQAGFARMLATLGLPAETPIAVCYSDARSKDARYNQPADCARRKPSGAMIAETAAALGQPLADVTFIGDRPEDEQAAAAAGVRFVWAADFFGESV